VKDLSATEASRRFSELLDAVEHRGASFTVVRHGRPVALITPATVADGRSLKDLLLRHRSDPAWPDDLERLRSLLEEERSPWSD
jgi:prevent-host-death family protein